jgi:hypothetical protein
MYRSLSAVAAEYILLVYTRTVARSTRWSNQKIDVRCKSDPVLRAEGATTGYGAVSF